MPAETATPEPSATPIPIANDDYWSATTIYGFTFVDSVDTTTATWASDDPNMGIGNGSNYNTVWYLFTPYAPGRIRVDSFGSNYDTGLAVFTGTRGSLTLLASNDDAPNPRESYYDLQSEMSFDVQQGVTYSLEVASIGSGGGSMRLVVDFAPGSPATATATPAAIPTETPLPMPTFPPLVTAVLLPTPSPATVLPRVVPADDRYFPQTSYRVESEAGWDYFQKRGGVGTFGFPVSQSFTLLGFRVQFFQRGIQQTMPDGSVAWMNLLDEGLMPYTRINSSIFPGPDQELITGAPLPSDPAYGDQAIAFVEANVPDQWDGQQVGFLQTFMSSVRYEDAFPNGDGDPALIPLLDLELWGLPTSRPAYDPNNHNFVYQRFQRGIMHFDLTTGATQGLLLADYLKSILTGTNLPPDLEAQAWNSPFYRQYDYSAQGWLARPDQLPGTDLTGAFDPPVVR